jgi:cobalt-zinc-cadmium efflux system outer membrane protein
VLLLPLGFSLILFQQGGTDSLTLRAAVDHALAARGQVIAAGATIARARAERRLAGQLPNPAASYTYTEDPPRQHVTLQQSFDWLLRSGIDRSAARASQEAAEADSAVTAAQVAADTRQAFYRVLATVQSLVLLEEETTIADSLSAIARERLDKGDISQLEADQLLLESARAHQSLSRGREDHQAALANLRRALAWPPDRELPALSGRLDESLETDSIAVSSSREIPSVRARVADSAAAARRIRSSRASRIPIPALEVGMDWDDPGNSNRKLLVVGVSIPLPLWNVGSADVAVAQANADEAAGLAREAHSEFEGRSQETRIRMSESAKRARVARDSLLPAARHIRERTALAYRLGETSIIPLLEALRVEREVALSTIEELLAFQEARASWNNLIGVVE